MATDLLICLPFAGFYESKWSDLVDHEVESWAEYHPETEEEQDQPKHLRLDASDAGEIAFQAMDYSAAYHAMAKDYPEALDLALRDELGFSLGLRFESTDSPREYNFATDRVYAFLPYRRALRLLALARRDNFGALGKAIRDRFTSRSGFLSHYSNDLADWQAKPFAEWDHNELGTLLLAYADCEAAEWSAYESLSDYGYQYFDDAMDWQKLESLIENARDEKAERWAEENPTADAAPAPYRCRITPDLFAWKGALA